MVLTLALAVDASSERPLRVVDVQARPLPDGAKVLALQPGLIQPGEHRPIGTLVVPESTEVPTLTVDLTLHDGLGHAQATVRLEPWSAQHDITELIRVSSTSGPRIQVQGVHGPLEGTPIRSEAAPTYGYLEWPDGRREALPGFHHGIQVPRGYPDELKKGDRVRFAIPGAYDTVTWYMDEEAYHTGATLPLDVGGGPHALSVHVGDQGPHAELRFVTDDRITFHGHILAGTPAVEKHISGVNGNLLFFPIFEEARDLQVTVHPTTSTGPTDIDLYLYDPSGDLVAKAEGPRPSEELRYAGPFVEGDHHLEVHGTQGADIRFNATITVDYTP